MFSELKEMKSRGDVDALFAFLHSNKDDSEKGWMARLDTAEALAQLGDQRGIDYLHKMAESPNKDVQEIASEIIDGLRNYRPEPVVKVKNLAQPNPEGWLYKINSKYPYLVAWVAFIALYFLAVTVLNPVATLFVVATDAWLPGWVSSLVLLLLLLAVGFFVFRYVIRKLVLPYENKA